MQSITLSSSEIMSKFFSTSERFFDSLIELPDAGDRYVKLLTNFTLENLTLACVPALTQLPPATVDEGIATLMRRSRDADGRIASLAFCSAMERLLRDLERLVEIEKSLRKQARTLGTARARWTISNN